MKKPIRQYAFSALSITGLLTLYIGTHLYLIILLRITPLNPQLLQFAVVFLAISPLLSGFLNRGDFVTIPVQRILTRMGYLWLGILLLLLMSIVGVHVFNGVLLLSGWGAMTPQAIYSSILVMTTGMTIYGLYAAYRSPRVVEYTVDRRQRYGQNKSLSIVQLSDLHLGYDLGHRFLNNVIRTTNALNPDIIVITGDIMESSPAYFRRFRQDFRKFQAPYGTYAVTGNHDFYNGAAPFIKIMEESGIPVLQNELIRLQNNMQLIGIHDQTANRNKRLGFESNLAKALSSKVETNPSILLAHQPKDYQLAVDKAVDLILCGHTHNGQIFPIPLIVKKVYDYVSGHHRLGSFTDLIISQGTGFWGPPLRLGANSQIVKIELLY